jgi:hypothetical protein
VIKVYATPKGTGGKAVNITPIVSRVSWSSNLDQIAKKVELTVFDDRSDLFPQNPVERGSIIALVGETGELFRGIVMDDSKAGREPAIYTAFDAGIYLANNKEIFQFNNIRVDSAIRQVLDFYSIPTAFVNSISIMVDRYYIDKSAIEIIKDLLDEARKFTGRRYMMRTAKGRFYIEVEGSTTIAAKFKLYAEDTEHDATVAIGNAQRTGSTEKMRNSIKVLFKEEKEGDTLIENVMTLKDSTLIRDYGLLQEVIEIPAEDKPKAKQIATNMLADLGKVEESFSIRLFGDERVEAGVNISDLSDDIVGIDGTFLVKGAVHLYEREEHTMDLDLVKI